MITVDVRGESEVKLALGSLQLRAGTARRLLRLAGQAVYRQHQLNMVRGVDPNGVPLPPVQRWTRLVSGYNPFSKVLHRTGHLRKSMGILSTTDSSVVVGFSGAARKVAENMTNGTPGRIKLSEKYLTKASRMIFRRRHASKIARNAIAKYRRKMSEARAGVELNHRPEHEQREINRTLRRHRNKIRTALGQYRKDRGPIAFKIERKENTGRNYERKRGTVARSESGVVGVNVNDELYVRAKRNNGKWFTKRVSGGTVSVRPQPRRFFYLGAPDIAEINAVARAFYAQLVAKANRGRT